MLHTTLPSASHGRVTRVEERAKADRSQTRLVSTTFDARCPHGNQLPPD